MTKGEHRRSGGHDHRHRGSHRHSSESHPHTFSDSFSSHSEGGGGGGGGGFGEAGGAAHGGGAHSSSFGGGHDAHGGAAAHAMDATFVWKLSKLGRIGSSRLRFDDDFADRLNYQYTGVLMFLFIGLIGIRQYVGKPIQCWIPQEFTRGWEEYAENYCWVSNTYFAPIQNRLPPAPDREMLLIGYYQWAPIVMAIQAMAFYLPCLIWRLFMAQSGFNVRRILQMACDSNVLLPEHTMKNVRFIARYMEGCIYRQRDYRRRRSNNTMTGYSPTNYTGLGHLSLSHQPLQTTTTAAQQQQQAHHHHHLGYHYHHHHLPHAQSPPYASPPHAPPLYTSTQAGTFGTRSHPGPMQTSPDSRGRGNGGAPHYDPSTPQNTSSTIGRRGRRPTNSLLDRLRLRFSVSSELAKNKKLGRLSGAEDTALPGGGTPDSRGATDDQPMLDKHRCKLQGAVDDDVRQTYCSSDRSTFRGAGDHNQSAGSGCCGKRHGNYLVVLYFFIKLLYLTNIVGQLFMMEKFVGNNYTFYGLRVLLDLIRGHEWFHSGNFPRVTFCDFEAKKLGKNHKYTLQCVLPLNMFLEKIYIFLWFWHCMVGVITLSSFIMWFYRMGFPSRRVKFIRKYLKIMSVLRETDKAASHKFVENYLRPDGVFLIRLISINVGDLMAGDLACELWHIYRHKRLHEAEEQKYLDATGMLSDFVLPSTGVYEPGAPVAAGDIALNVTGRGVDKHSAASAPLTSANLNNNNSGNNNDDSIV